jgi:hypothetical protein
MSIIYSYPIKGTPANDDLILISDSASSPQFATKQIKVSSLPGGSASGVSSFNTLTGAVTITGGTNVTLNPVGSNIEINASGGGGAVDSVNTTDGTYINLTPNSATTGAVTVSADLSAVDGTSTTATKFLSKDNTWDVPSYTTNTTDIILTTTGSSGAAVWNGTTLNIPQYSGGGGGGHTVIDMADTDSILQSANVNAAYLMTTTVDSSFTASSIKIQFNTVPVFTGAGAGIEVAIYTYVESGINSATPNIRLGFGSSSSSTTKRKVITLTADTGQSLALTAGTNYVVAFRSLGGGNGSGVFAASNKFSNVSYAAVIDSNPSLPETLETGGGVSFIATGFRPALTIY